MKQSISQHKILQFDALWEDFICLHPEYFSEIYQKTLNQQHQCVFPGWDWFVPTCSCLMQDNMSVKPVNYKTDKLGPEIP